MLDQIFLLFFQPTAVSDIGEGYDMLWNLPSTPLQLKIRSHVQVCGVLM